MSASEEPKRYRVRTDWRCGECAKEVPAFEFGCGLMICSECLWRALQELRPFEVITHATE